MKLTKKEQGKLNKQLLAAIEQNDFNAVKAAVAAGADVNTHNKYSYSDTPLIKSTVDTVDLKIMEFLLEHGADPNSQDEEGDTALHCCSPLEDMLKAKLLLAHNADMYIKNDGGRTPFAAIISWDRDDMAIAELYVLNGYLPTEEDFDVIENIDERTEVKAHFTELARQMQNHNAKLMEAADIDQEVQCCDECFDF